MVHVYKHPHIPYILRTVTVNDSAVLGIIHKLYYQLIHTESKLHEETTCSMDCLDDL